MIQKRLQRKIDFLIVGTQKGGTSALDKYLRDHPEVGMGKRKELHFFDNETIFSDSKIDYTKYENQFEFTSNLKVYGEATPIYIYWEPCGKRIWEYNPNIKLIFILRNPIQRAFSHWNMEFDRNADHESFSNAIRYEVKRTKESSTSQHRVYSYIDRGMYAKQIKRYIQYFSAEQMLFIKYEEFKKNQKQELNRIFDFLKVKSDLFSFEYREVNNRTKHATLTITDKDFLIEKFENDIRQVEKILGWNCSDWLE